MDKNKTLNSLKKIKIKTAFIVSIVIVLAFSFTITALSGWNAFKKLSEKQSKEDLLLASSAISSEIQSIFDCYIGIASSFSKSEIAILSAKGANPKSFDDYANSLIDIDSNILSLLICDKEGFITSCTLDKSPGHPFEEFGEDLKLLDPFGVYVSSLHEGYFNIVCPIYDESDIIGYSAISVSSKTLDFDFFEGSLYIKDKNVKNIIKNNSIIESDSFIKTLLAEDTSSVKSIYETYKIRNNKLSVFGNISRTDWKWAATTSYSDIEKKAAEMFIKSFVPFIITASFLLFISAFIAFKTGSYISVIKEKIKNENAGITDKFETSKFSDIRNIYEVFNLTAKATKLDGELYRTASQISDNLLFDWDVRSETFFVSDNFTKLIPLDMEKAKFFDGTFLDSLMDEENAECFRRETDKLIKTGENLVSEYKITRPGDNESIWISFRAKCGFSRTDELIHIVGVITDINNEKTIAQSLENKASFDFLSTLYNRATFLRMLANELERDKTSPIAVIFIDVDDFKFINDRYSHSVGDEIIKHIAYVIKDTLLEDGFAGRFGGDEFVICVNNPERVSAIATFGYDLIQSFAKSYYSADANVTLKIKTSIGISLSPKHGRDTDLLVSRADEAMYFVKKNGKSNYHIFEESEVTDKDNIMF